MKELFKKYIREYTLPEIFCPGCGYGIFLNAFIRALNTMNVQKGDIGSNLRRRLRRLDGHEFGR